MTPRSVFPTLRRTSLALALALAGGCASTPATHDTASPVATHDTASPVAAFDADEQAQRATEVLRRYEAALNRGDVDTIVSLYAPDAVFMAQHRSPAVGRELIEGAYREILGTIRLSITFEIDEVVVVSPTVAYARTRSAGTTTILADGAEIAEGNQELFFLVRDEAEGDWRIGRYIFSTTQPRS